MEATGSTLQVRQLQYTHDQEEYDLYRAALEWDLADPIVIEKREDFKSELRWKDKLEPFHHQVKNLITFCRRLPVTLLADDVGLGKTISAGLVASELISRGRVSRILIVCPKILRDQWKEELKSKFGITSVIATGSELITIRPTEDVAAVITTYNSARLYLNQIGNSEFDMLVLDEAHKLRNLYGVEPAPQVALRFREALANRLFKYVLMLTATPIQNRLWDIYSLVDLLTVARGHENPFGTQNMFAYRFIADNRTKARQLIPDMQNEFRSIVYGYMSRIRRNDTNLQFPDRIVQLHLVEPSQVELALMKIISEHIQKLNFLSQIVILQALISSPQALVAMLNGMATKGTVPLSLAEGVRNAAKGISTTSKLKGLAVLIKTLMEEQPEKWRMVVFTRWRQTQSAIESFLAECKIPCGIINGDSNERNLETIWKFKKDKPEIHVIISTEAGSEGVNLQVANVLVNYDLPWNPMIVEQRIGRIQRLASIHAKVCIVNIILKGTFEQYIVARLLEKLQMAAQAIGDIDALLAGAGLDTEEKEGANGFESKILQLVLASLAGKNIEEATRKTEKSIIDAKNQLEIEQEYIKDTIGATNYAMSDGPSLPNLPGIVRSMDFTTFVLKALRSQGSKILRRASNVYVSDMDGKQELIYLGTQENNNDIKGTLFGRSDYHPGSPTFERLVTKIVNRGLHRMRDADQNHLQKAEAIARDWIDSFKGQFIDLHLQEVQSCFVGSILIRIRATVAHDSYERLIDIHTSLDEGNNIVVTKGLEQVLDIIDEAAIIGFAHKYLIDKAKLDPGITEFCRFYNERRADELKAAGKDQRKIKKLTDEFTPRLEFVLVGLDGLVRRQLILHLKYNIDSAYEYTSDISIVPSLQKILDSPEMGFCQESGRLVPQDCLGECDISSKEVLLHLLTESEISERFALAKHIKTCTLSGKRVLEDEITKSDITGQFIISELLQTSPLSGQRAEPVFFGRCEFSLSEVLNSELATSQVSGKRYRIDQQLCSEISAKKGHINEFILCHLSKKPLLLNEAGKCEITGKLVLPYLMETCELSGKKVLPSELEKSPVSRRWALKKFFIASSISGTRLLEVDAVSSMTGKYCLPAEAKICIWSDRISHPDDLRTCSLTGLSIYYKYISYNLFPRLEALDHLLCGTLHSSDNKDMWKAIKRNASISLDRTICIVKAAHLSPNGKMLAVCLEVLPFIILKERYAGFLYSVEGKSIIGKIVEGKRKANDWFDDDYWKKQ